jgi:3-deoxy-D-manno-octulosonic-acid transferase
METPLLLNLYRLAMRAAAPLLPVYLKRRAQDGKEDLSRLNERFGHGARPRPDGPLIWVHGASLGETAMAVPIIEKILNQNPSYHVLVTSGTVTSAKLMQERLPPRAFHQYIPADTPKAVNRFLDHWTPDLGLWLESEIWPNLIVQSQARHIPLLLLNARLSEKSRQGWQKRPRTARRLFAAFHNIYPADGATAESLSQILDREISVFGNLKLAAPPLTADPTYLVRLKGQIGERRLWCAASTHDGEEAIILTAHKALLKSHPDALLILIPRHPERSAKITDLITQNSLSYSRISDEITRQTQILLIDEIGKMGLAYSLAPSVLMGGSLCANLKGHNPYEPAQLGCAVLSGPYVSSFEELYKDMETAGAVRILTPDPAAITKIIRSLWDAPAQQNEQSQNAKTYAAKQSDNMARLLHSLTPFISRLSQL